MPLSFNESTATGVTTPGSSLGTDFPIYFPYLAKAHINVDFNKVLQSQANFVVYDANEAIVPAGAFGTSTAFVRFTAGYPTAGTTVRVRRTTEKSFPLVDFQDGSALTADDQDLAFLQNFYLNQESVEQADNALGKVGLVYYANGIRITEVGQPTQNNDATTKLYVDTQDALKVTKAGDTMSGALAMGNNKITGLGTPTVSTDASTKAYVDTNDALKVTKAGDTMSGALAMGNNKITGLGTPTASTDATTKTYVDTADATLTSSKVSKSGDTMSGALAMGNNKITGLGTPTVSDDASTKAYADTKLSLSGGVLTGAVDFGGFTINDVGEPQVLNDAATKQYVDASIQQFITTGGVSGNPTRWQFTGDGSTLVFNISGATAIYTNSYLVAIDGVVQDPTYSYNVSIVGGSQTLTFDQAPPSGTRIVVIALGYALPTISAIPNNTVSTNALVDDAVTSAKLRDDASVDANRAVTTNHIRDLAVTTAKLAANAVTDTKLSSDASVDANRAVNTNHIKDSSVTTAKLNANAVTDTKLSSDASVDANRAVNTNHIKDLAVTTAKLSANAVTDAKLSSSASVDASRAVTTNHIRDLAVTDAKLASNSVTDAKLSVIAGLTAGTYGSASAIPVFGINTTGRITSASTAAITIPSQKVVNMWSTSLLTSITLSGFSWTNVLSQAVSLANSNNRVFLTGMVHSNAKDYCTNLRILRGATAIGGGTITGARLSVHSWLNSYLGNTNAGYHMMAMPIDWVDTTPGATSVTYTIQCSSYSGAVSYINRTHIWQAAGASGYDGCPVSTLTIFEVTP